MNNHRLLQALSIKPFLYLWIAEIFSQVAMNMINFVLIIVAFQIAKSNTAVAGIVLSFTIPAILLGMIAGVYVDRFNKKRVLIYTNIIRAILLVILALTYKNLGLVYVLSFVIACVTQFFIPAETPIIPRVVRKDLLLSANALFGMGIYGSILIGYALSTPLLTFFGATNSFFVIALLFIIASVFVGLIHITKLKKEQDIIPIEAPPSSVSRELKHAFLIMIKTKKIYQSLLLLAFSQILILILGVVGPGFASQILGISVDQFPLLFVTPAALGMVLGAVFLGNYFHNLSKEKCATIGVLIAGLSMLLLPYGSKVASREIVHTINYYLPNFLDITILHIMVFLAFIMGIANSLVFVPSNTILQEETDDEFRGRVYGALSALVGALSLIPIIIVGELADAMGVGKVITGIGMLILIFGLVRVPAFFNINPQIKNDTNT